MIAHIPALSCGSRGVKARLDVQSLGLQLALFSVGLKVTQKRHQGGIWISCQNHEETAASWFVMLVFVETC